MSAARIVYMELAARRRSLASGPLGRSELTVHPNHSDHAFPITKIGEYIMKVFVNLCLIAICATSLIIAGCSATASLNKIQTSNNYTNKLPLKAAVYIPSELSNREVITSPSTATCSMWKAKVNSGNGYYTAIESGLSAAIQVVDVGEYCSFSRISQDGRIRPIGDS